VRLVIQRVEHASVSVEGQEIGSIKRGFLVLAGTTHGDEIPAARKLAEKTARLRIFPDEQGKTGLSLLDIQGEALVVSQFTLYADTRKGNRPSFGKAGPPDQARILLDHYVQSLKELGVSRVQTGLFGADMQVDLRNSGPFTIVLDS